MSHVVSKGTIAAAIEAGGLRTIAIDADSIGDNTAIAAVAGQRIVLLSMHLVASAATNVVIQSGAAALTGTMALTANQLLDVEDGPSLWTADGEALIVNVSADGVNGWASYVLL